MKLTKQNVENTRGRGRNKGWSKVYYIFTWNPREEGRRPKAKEIFAKIISQNFWKTSGNRVTKLR